MRRNPAGTFLPPSGRTQAQKGRVIVVDHVDYRLEFARRFAHAETINFTQVNDIVQWAKNATEYLGADVCIEAVGAEADGALFQHVTSAKFKLQGGSPSRSTGASTRCGRAATSR